MDSYKRKDRGLDNADGFQLGVEEEDEQTKKKSRQEKLKAWKSQQQQSGTERKQNKPHSSVWAKGAHSEALENENGVKDVAAEIAYRRAFAGIKEQEMRNRMKAQAEDEEDPLDAFMKTEIAPEVQARQEEDKQKQKEQELASEKDGVNKSTLKFLHEDDSEEEADMEIQVPMNKVKLLVGPNGTKIQEIQKKARCRIQIKKTEADLNKAFGSGMLNYIPEHRLAGKEASQRFSIVQIFGSGRSIQLAQRLINEAIENKDQKQRNRQREYEKKKEEKRKNRQLFLLRHTKDYQMLGVEIGASREIVKKAYKELARKWHPDKHPKDKEAAKVRFQAIQQAFDSLMRHDEDERIEQLQ
eukprot:TRINITY_DN5398_c1_g4_i1.p1 TRINITY_DN5398_c1_g4~~TRINITY_DN5398_c1_g4_i1.p1  ORF type:complete len:376 (-),score=65.46 TRINITY_DN5398_c1_g4_i1:557-1624(-)